MPACPRVAPRMDGAIDVACRRGRWSGRPGNPHRSVRWPQRAPASEARPPTREGRGAGAAPHKVHAGMLFPRTRTGRPALSSSTSPTCANTGCARPGMRGNRAEWPLRWLMRCAEWPGPHGATVHAGTTRGRAWTRGRDHLCAARHELSGRRGGDVVSTPIRG